MALMATMTLNQKSKVERRYKAPWGERRNKEIEIGSYRPLIRFSASLSSLASPMTVILFPCCTENRSGLLINSTLRRSRHITALITAETVQINSTTPSLQNPYYCGLLWLWNTEVTFTLTPLATPFNLNWMNVVWRHNRDFQACFYYPRMFSRSQAQIYGEGEKVRSTYCALSCVRGKRLFYQHSSINLSYSYTWQVSKVWETSNLILDSIVKEEQHLPSLSRTLPPWPRIC